MGLGPILPGRLPTGLASERLSRGLESTKLDLQRVQDQITTGQKYLVPSESPASALRTIILQKTLERKQQFLSNVQTDRSLINSTEDALSSVNESINSAKTLLLQGLTTNISSADREALANEVSSLITSISVAGNTQFRGRYLFGGSRSDSPPFVQAGNNKYSYQGDTQGVESFLDFNQTFVNNIDGVTAFNPLATVSGSDLNVGLSLNTRISDLHGGRGVELGTINVAVDDGSSLIGQTIDLTGAETIGDLKTRIESAFASSSATVVVDIDPSAPSGLRITPSTGSVTVLDVTGSRVAANLGIASGLTTQIAGADLDPRLTLQTKLSDLNAGTGIGITTGNGLFIVNGDKSQAVDISSAETIQDLLNTLQLAGLDLATSINDAGNGLAISSRISGAKFSIGENNGSNAAGLGIRSFQATTQLLDLNFGNGINSAATQKLQITRRDGSLAEVDLSAARSVQDVLDAINAVDPGNLNASLALVGNGISITDSSGTGPLSIANNELAQSLGLAGTESGTDPAVPLIGQDVNQRQSKGLLSILSQLEQSLRSGDLRTLGRLNGELETEANRFFMVRGLIGTRQRTLDNAENRLRDEDITLNENLATEFDIDLSEAYTEFVARQQTLQATYQAASQTLQLNLLAFL